jgi:predicted component of type VI protein secretion system
MKLTLTVLFHKGQPFFSNPVIIGAEGGSIGRSESCSLVLNDVEQIISRDHAVIQFKNGEFYFQDTSADGSQIDYQGCIETVHQNLVPLREGTRIKIGAYEISVGIVADPVILELLFSQVLSLQAPQPPSLLNPLPSVSALLKGETHFEPSLITPPYIGSLLNGDDVPLQPFNLISELPRPATSVFDEVIFTLPSPLEMPASALFEQQHISDLREAPIAVNFSDDAPSLFDMAETPIYSRFYPL